MHASRKEGSTTGPLFPNPATKWVGYCDAMKVMAQRSNVYLFIYLIIYLFIRPDAAISIKVSNDGYFVCVWLMIHKGYSLTPAYFANIAPAWCTPF
jgi:hypothetical protein